MHIATGSVKLSDLPATGEWTINPGGITGTGTSYTIPDLKSGTYNFTVTNTSGCTSQASTAVTINEQSTLLSYNITENEIKCQGESYKGHTTSGIYIDTLQTVNGCDSIITTNLTINPVYVIMDSVTICQGESYNGHTKNVVYLENLKSVSGCDSIIITTLMVIKADTCKTYINEISASDKIKIYPNPTTGMLEVLISEPFDSDYKIEIFNPHCSLCRQNPAIFC